MTDTSSEAAALAPDGAALSLDAMGVDRAILDDLVAKRRLSGADTERLVEISTAQGQRLGRLLVTAGALSQEVYRDELGARLHIGVWEAPGAIEELSTEYAALLPAPFLRHNEVAPVRLEEGRLSLAMALPPDEALLESVRQATGLDVEPLAATQRDVGRTLDHLLAGVEAKEQEAGSEALALDEGALRDLASEAPVVQFLSAAFERAVALGASDIHLERSERRTRMRYRVDGELLDALSPEASLYAGVVSRIKIMARLDVGERRLPQDGRIQLQTSGRQVDVRVSILPSVHGEEVALRILDRGTVQLDLDELGLHVSQRAAFRRLVRRPEGMVLLTGPTGSGKTTTLYSGLKEIARPNVKVVTVEDPVEYHLDGVNQIQVKPEIGLDFARCLRSILRHDPDVIMVGEIRDKETAAMAVQSALTGHLVLSTLHTNSAAGAFARLLDMGVEDYLVASALIGVMAQRLVRRVCPSCVEAAPIDAAVREKFGLPAGATFHAGKGCRACLNTGYRGRTVVGELLETNEAVQRAALEGRSSAEIHRVAVEQGGMMPLWRHGLEKVMAGETSFEQVVENIQE